MATVGVKGLIDYRLHGEVSIVQKLLPQKLERWGLLYRADYAIAISLHVRLSVALRYCAKTTRHTVEIYFYRLVAKAQSFWFYRN